MPPCEAEKQKNHAEIRERNAKVRAKVKSKKPQFSIGDTVLISKEKSKFFRKYDEQFSREVFRIHSVDTNLPIPLYEIAEYDPPHQKIIGKFYSFELTPILITSKTFKVERILDKKKVGKEHWFLIKFISYSRPHWVHEKDLIQL